MVPSKISKGYDKETWSFHNRSVIVFDFINIVVDTSTVNLVNNRKWRPSFTKHIIVVTAKAKNFLIVTFLCLSFVCLAPFNSLKLKIYAYSAVTFFKCQLYFIYYRPSFLVIRSIIIEFQKNLEAIRITTGGLVHDSKAD